MGVAKKLGKNPREFGEEVLNALDLSGMVEKLELAGPGFINIHLANTFLSESLNSLIASGQLIQNTESPQTVVVDYSSPNLAKEMHVGHMRGTIIGDALVRIFEHLGHKVIRQNHFGDWGTQFGMIIYGFKHFRQEDAYQAAPVPELTRLYKQVQQLIEYHQSRQQLPQLEQQVQELLVDEWL